MAHTATAAHRQTIADLGAIVSRLHRTAADTTDPDEEWLIRQFADTVSDARKRLRERPHAQ